MLEFALVVVILSDYIGISMLSLFLRCSKNMVIEWHINAINKHIFFHHTRMRPILTWHVSLRRGAVMNFVSSTSLTNH